MVRTTKPGKKTKTTPSPVTGKTIKQAARLYADASVEKIKQYSIAMSEHIVPKQAVKRLKEQFPDSRGKVGAPSKYTATMCRRVVEIMAEGRSRDCACTMLGISSVTLMKWTDEKSPTYRPEFVKAIKEGERLSQLWWKEQGRLNLHNNKEFDHVLWMMNMSNRFGWTRRVDGTIEHKGKVDHAHYLDDDEKQKRAEDAYKIMFEETNAKEAYSEQLDGDGPGGDTLQ